MAAPGGVGVIAHTRANNDIPLGRNNVVRVLVRGKQWPNLAFEIEERPRYELTRFEMLFECAQNNGTN